jgi:hypothetical protein
MSTAAEPEFGYGEEVTVTIRATVGGEYGPPYAGQPEPTIGFWYPGPRSQHFAGVVTNSPAVTVTRGHSDPVADALNAADLNAQELGEMRSRHDQAICAHWPCDVSRLLAVIDALVARHGGDWHV